MGAGVKGWGRCNTWPTWGLQEVPNSRGLAAEGVMSAEEGGIKGNDVVGLPTPAITGLVRRLNKVGLAAIR